MKSLKHVSIPSSLLIPEHDEVGAPVLPNVALLNVWSANNFCAGLQNLQTLCVTVMPPYTVFDVLKTLTRLSQLSLRGEEDGSAIFNMGVRTLYFTVP